MGLTVICSSANGIVQQNQFQTKSYLARIVITHTIMIMVQDNREVLWYMTSQRLRVMYVNVCIHYLESLKGLVTDER